MFTLIVLSMLYVYTLWLIFHADNHVVYEISINRLPEEIRSKDDASTVLENPRYQFAIKYSTIRIVYYILLISLFFTKVWFPIAILVVLDLVAYPIIEAMISKYISNTFTMRVYMTRVVEVINLIILSFSGWMAYSNVTSASLISMLV